MAYDSGGYGPAGLNKINFFETDFNTEGPLSGMGGGGSGGGKGGIKLQGRAPLLTSGFGPELNLGSGPMAPAAALHQFNLERGKYTAPNMQAYQSTQSGEATARLRHLVSQQQKNRGTMGTTAATWRRNPYTGGL